MTLTLLLGGVRAGKSARALSLASESSAQSSVLFVATAQAFDDEMRRRIVAHQRERPAHWHTLESPIALPEDITAQLTRTAERYRTIVVDCLTLWVSNILLSLSDDADAESIVANRTRDLLLALRERRAIIVSNEVGLGIVPPTPLGRRYRDALGRANQIVAAEADDVRLLVAGIELVIKPSAAHRG